MNISYINNRRGALCLSQGRQMGYPAWMCCWTDICSTDRAKRGDPRCIRDALIYIISLICGSWWRHQMETFSALLALCVVNSPVTGEFPAQRPLTRSLNGVFDLCQNEQLSKQSWGWWFETPSRLLLRQSNIVVLLYLYSYGDVMYLSIAVKNKGK